MCIELETRCYANSGLVSGTDTFAKKLEGVAKRGCRSWEICRGNAPDEEGSTRRFPGPSDRTYNSQYHDETLLVTAVS
jgi:hypothetical protein